MAWIREEEGLNLANVIKVMSINPGAMKAVNDLNSAITFGASAVDARAGGGYCHNRFGAESVPLLNDGSRGVSPYALG